MDRAQSAHAFLLLMGIVGAMTFGGSAALLCAFAAVLAGAAGVVHELRPRPAQL
jgi:hypothetical protein